VNGYEEALNYLRMIRKMPISLRVLSDKIKVLETQIVDVNSTAISDNEHVNSSNVSDKMKSVDRLIDLKNELEAEKESYRLLLSESNELINQLSKTEYKTIIFEYYINRKTMEYIADNIVGLTVRHLYRLRKYALKEFQKILSQNKKNDKNVIECQC
jgi:replicative superfamily II helicase